MAAISRNKQRKEFTERIERCGRLKMKLIEDEERERKKAPIQQKQNDFYIRRKELIIKGLSFEEIKEILLSEYPDLVAEKMKIKIPQEDGSESNAFDIQLKDQIRRYGKETQENEGSKKDETDGR